MEMADKWNRYEIVVDKGTVAFVQVPSNLKQFFHDGVPQVTFSGCCPCLKTWPLCM
jgi:hypothetical protein